MKTLNKYMAMPYRMELIKDKDEGGYVVSYPDLPGCITRKRRPEMQRTQKELGLKRRWKAERRFKSRIMRTLIPDNSGFVLRTVCTKLLLNIPKKGRQHESIFYVSSVKERYGIYKIVVPKYITGGYL